jgi:hypothetical protein
MFLQSHFSVFVIYSHDSDFGWFCKTCKTGFVGFIYKNREWNKNGYFAVEEKLLLPVL